jgi:hypothetical protein
LTASAVFDLLSNARRRCVIHFLFEDPRTTVRELSSHVAAWEYDVELSAVAAKQRKRVYTGLHQTHLPRLDEHGVIEYDSDRGDVRATDRLRVFEPYFDSGEADETNWPAYYLGLGIAATAVAVGAVAGIPVVGAMQTGLLALLFGTGLVILAAVHASVGPDTVQPPHYPDLEPNRWADEAPVGD